MALNEVLRSRHEKLERLKALGVEPYPYRYEPTHHAEDILSGAAQFEAHPEEVVRVAGRLVAHRGHGKAGFGHVLDETGRIQVYARQDILGEDGYLLWKELDLGDFLGVEGPVFRTKTGEITVQARQLTFLAKSMRPLPEKFHGLKDVEVRSRQRYVDLVANPEVRAVFRSRSRIVSSMRRFLEGRRFLEVETPILQPIYGGAFARPFVTRHNALDMELYMRISFELYLKRLLVGGFERVFEIGRDFRNEGVDRSHNPEFTQMEAYQAYADYHDMMDLTEAMVAAIATEVFGGTQLPYGGDTLSWAAPWPRLRLFELLRDHAGADLSGGDARAALDACRRNGITPGADWDYGRAVDELFSERVQPRLVQPCFVLDYPRDLSPLAKEKRGAPHLVERFEAFAGGMELANSFSEQNSPLAQQQAFRRQAELREAGNLEAQPEDRDFLRALEYGMPPAGGLGVGVDRLCMLLTDQHTIREVLLFPHLRPERDLDEEEGAGGEGPGEGAGAGPRDGSGAGPRDASGGGPRGGSGGTE
ncbi:MAG: lysine--tRNA ligase [Candidatus Eisenbacteria bacterium]|nr:lysine--tRNA ligase [Candidatus Eisenbacteria bacterium]